MGAIVVEILFSLAFADGCNTTTTGNGFVLLNGNGVAGVPVSFTVTGPATVSPTNTTTGAGGAFSTGVMPFGPGNITITITATINNLPPISSDFNFVSPCPA